MITTLKKLWSNTKKQLAITPRITYKENMLKEKNMAKAPNYTAETTTKLVELYAEGKGLSIPELAEEFSKTPRSIISKLVRENVYVPAEKGAGVTKTEGPGKKELLRFLEEVLPSGFPVDGLLPAKKESLVALIDYLNDEFTGTMTDEEEAETFKNQESA